MKIVGAEAGELRAALGADPDQAGFTQHPEVMGPGGLGEREVERGARDLVVREEVDDNPQPRRIAKGVQDIGEPQLVARRMTWFSHASADATVLVCSQSIEQLDCCDVSRSPTPP